VSGGAPQPAQVLYQTAPRTFTGPFVLDHEAENLRPTDLDADGDLDFIAVSSSSPFYHFSFQLAPRRFSSLAPIEGVFVLSDAADVDSDGDVDLVYRGYSALDQVVIRWGGR